MASIKQQLEANIVGHWNFRTRAIKDLSLIICRNKI